VQSATLLAATHQIDCFFSQVLTHGDVVELLGPRPFEMSDNYKEYVDTNHKWLVSLPVLTGHVSSFSPY